MQIVRMKKKPKMTPQQKELSRLRKEHNAAQKSDRSQVLREAKASGYRVTAAGELEHRAVWQRHNGWLPKGWIVHHINEVKTDNRIENLIGMPSELHDSVHRIQRQYQVRFSKEQLTGIVAKWRESAAQIDAELSAHYAAIAKLTADKKTLGESDLLDAINVAESTTYRVNKAGPL